MKRWVLKTSEKTKNRPKPLFLVFWLVLSDQKLVTYRAPGAHPVGETPNLISALCASGEAKRTIFFPFCCDRMKCGVQRGGERRRGECVNRHKWDFVCVCVCVDRWMEIECSTFVAHLQELILVLHTAKQRVAPPALHSLPRWINNSQIEVYF